MIADNVLNAHYLVASLIWGSVGLGLFIYGKKQQSMVPLFGGLLIIGNMNETSLSNLWPMDFLADWTLEYRNEAQMLRWVEGLETAERWTETERTGRVRLLFARKPR